MNKDVVAWYDLVLSMSLQCKPIALMKRLVARVVVHMALTPYAV